MKKTNTLRLIVLLLISFLHANNAFSQGQQEQVIPFREFSAYTNPPASAYALQALSTADAMEEIGQTFSNVGFNAAYFSTSDINNLLNHTECVGVRFYNAIEDPGMNGFELVAAPVKSDGSEIVNQSDNSYMMSRPVIGGYSTNPVSKSVAKTYVENAVNRAEITAYNVFFSKLDLENILKTRLCTGIKFSPGDRIFQGREANVSQSYYTMMIIPVDENLVELGDTYMQSIEPCPTLCPTDLNMLTPPSY